MQPINSAERRKAFWRFLLLFVVSIILITTTIFFSIRVPFRQNDQLRTENDNAQKEREYNDKFMLQMSTIAAMLDSINSNPSRADLLDVEASEKINRLDLSVEADSLNNKPFYKSIVILLRDLRMAKQQIRQIAGKDADAGELRRQKEELEKQLDSKNADIFRMQQQILQLQH